jgi:hypothetical protein
MTKMQARTDCGRGLDKAKVIRLDNGVDISRLNRDHFTDNRALKFQGVRRPLSNPHNIVWALQLASTCAIEGGMMIGMEVCRRIAAVEAYDEARKLAA